MSKPARLALVLLLVAALLLAFYLQQGGWMMIHPKYDPAKLIGLTREQVIARLGEPSFDPQSAITRPWNEAEDGVYAIGYFQGWATCRITFKEGKVDSVSRFWK